VAAVAAEVGLHRVRALALALLAHQEGFVELEVPYACGYIEGQLAGGSTAPRQPIPAADWTRLRSKLDFLFAPQGASKGCVRVSNAVLEGALFRAVAHPHSAEADRASLQAAREALVAMYAAHPAVQPSRSARMRALLHCSSADREGLLGALLCPAGLERLFWQDLVVREEFLGFLRAADGGRDSYSTAAEACEGRADRALQDLAGGGEQQQSQQQQLDTLRHAYNLGRALQLIGSLSKAARVLAGVAQATRQCLAAAAAAAAAQADERAQPALQPLTALHTEVLLLAGKAAMELGRYHSAFELLHECSALQAAPHPPTQLALGRCHFSVASYSPALAAVQLALQGTAPALSLGSASGDEAAVAGGGSAAALAGIFEALGDISLALRQAPQALQHYQRAAALQRAHSGELDAAVANLVGKVAQAHTAAGQCASAQLALQGVLSVQEMALGAAHPDLARTRVGLARVQAARGQPTASLQLLQAALAVQLQAEGEGSFGAATTLNNVAASLVEVGRYGQALAYFGRSLRAFSLCLGEDHPHTAGVLVNLSLAYELNGRLGDAIGCMKRAEAIHSRVFGAEHERLGSYAGPMRRCSGRPFSRAALASAGWSGE
jgi:tetratricopeptide (TPR) repeat protein